MTSQHAQDSEEKIRIGEAAKILGVHPQTVRDYEARGLIAASRTVGGERRFKRGDVEDLRDNPPEVYKRRDPREGATQSAAAL